MTSAHQDVDIQAEVDRIRSLPGEEKKKLDERVKQGETVVPGGTGGKSLEAQLNLAEGERGLCMGVSSLRKGHGYG